MKFPKFGKGNSEPKSEKADEPQLALPDKTPGGSLGDILAPRDQTPAAPDSAPASPGDAILSPAPAQPAASPGDAILSPAPAQPAANPADAILSPTTTPEPAPAPDADPIAPPVGGASHETASDPAADAQPDAVTDVLAEAAENPLEPETTDDVLAGLGDSDDEESTDDLLDIFKEAKEEVEESSLAAGLDDIPIGDIVADLSTTSERLGVVPKNVQQVPAAAPAEAPVAPAAAPAEAPVAPAAVPAEAPVAPAAAPAETPVAPAAVPAEAPVAPAGEPSAQPEPAAEADPTTPPATVTRVEQKPATPAAPAAAVPPASVDETLQAAPAVRRTESSAPTPEAPPETLKAPGPSSAPRQQMLHVVLIGLSLTLMAGLLGIGATGGGAGELLAAGTDDPTPAVLAYLKVPVIPLTEITSTPAPTPVSTTVPTDVPTPVLAEEPTASPSPTPEPPRTAADFGFDPLAPAFYSYVVEFGDSLTSISRDFGVCPDHILWNNEDRDEFTPLYVGDFLTLPGISGIVHTIRPGDSVDTLAARYSIDPDAIAAYPGNHLSPGDALTPGSRLLMPAGVPPGALLQDEDDFANTHYPSSDGFVWPYSGPVTTYYGEPRPGYTHNAIDIGGLGTFGQPIVAAAAGFVVSVQFDSDYGNNIIVDHGAGRHSRYAHLEDVHVTEGEYVQISQPLGTIGCTGASTGTHLHFELWQNGAAIDPLPLLP